jgi:polygalacturonase
MIEDEMLIVRIALAAAALPAFAQDTRKVAEPVIPPACATLKARIGRAGGSISPDDENKPDTARIQKALDGCDAGHAVILERASARLDAFLSGPLNLRRGVTLVISRGAWLYASRNPREYDLRPGVCGTITEDGHGCKALINGNAAPDAGVMGEGVIDGRGGETIAGQSITWWNLADRARAGGNQNNPRLLSLSHCDNFTLYRVTLMNSPNFHVGYNSGDGFTVWGVRIWSPERARNTDGIDPGNSTNVTIAYSYFHTGDDQIAIKAGAGSPTTHMTIAHNHFYTGHGMSIGSETFGGASAIRVSDLSIDGADNGLRIKSNITRGGLVHDVVYEDVCIRDTANPIMLDTNYSAGASKADNRPPVFRDITFRNVDVAGGGRITLEGVDSAHPVEVVMDNVFFENPARYQVSAAHAIVKAGPRGFNLPLRGIEQQGHDVAVAGNAASAAAIGCANRFVDFPLQ